MKTISLIIPCYNEEESIPFFYEAVNDLWKEKRNGKSLEEQYNLELCFIDDGSTDGTRDTLMALSSERENVCFTSFSRNFGKEAAIFCGLKQVTGDAAVVIDADLQHPVATIVDMIEKWENGAIIVEGRKKNRGKESVAYGFFAKMFYGFMSKMVGFDMQNSSDFKFLDRIAIEALIDMPEQAIFFRAMTFWLGFTTDFVEYEVNKRAAGTTKWSTVALIRYAIKNMTSYTYTPLYLIAFMGFLVLVVGVILLIDAIISYFVGRTVGGYPSLVLILVLGFGTVITSLGVIAIYIAKMFEEIKRRPRYIVKNTK